MAPGPRARGRCGTSPSLDFIVDVVDNNGTLLNLSAPISYGLTGTSLVGTCQETGRR